MLKGDYQYFKYHTKQCPIIPQSPIIYIDGKEGLLHIVKF